MSVSGAAAAAYMSPGRINIPSACLYTVWLAYGSPHTLGRLPGHTFGTAIEAYNYTTKRHTDRNPPVGAAVWFGACAGPRYAGDEHWRDGDVTVARAGARLGATDYPVFGLVGECDIHQREVQTGRAYLGWTEDIFGNDIILAAPSGSGATLITTGAEDAEEDDDMPKNSGFQYTRSHDGAIVYLIANTGSGFNSEYTDGGRGKGIPGSYNNPVAAAFDTGSYAKITEGHAMAIKAACDRVLS